MPYLLAGVIGCSFLYAGISLFIAMDIGLEPFSGIVMVIKDKFKLDFKTAKISFDIALIVIGFSLGGKVGILTLFTASTAGIVIQWATGKIQKAYDRIKL